jgi:hypothetical protein
MHTILNSALRNKKTQNSQFTMGHTAKRSAPADTMTKNKATGKGTEKTVGARKVADRAETVTGTGSRKRRRKGRARTDVSSSSESSDDDSNDEDVEMKVILFLEVIIEPVRGIWRILFG